ncbi:hypothetical protein cypCar_00024316 [Cyprinus carpio]|nr:hypothetical protein cypCar_00024316 [Cyprinus carpio]
MFADCGAGGTAQRSVSHQSHQHVCLGERCGPNGPRGPALANGPLCRARRWFHRTLDVQLLAECGSAVSRGPSGVSDRSDEGFVVMPAYDARLVDKPPAASRVLHQDLRSASGFTPTGGGRTYTNNTAALARPLSLMIYQQPNPGVRYEFIMPSENAVDAPHPKQNQLDVNAVNGPSTPEDHERSGVRHPPPVPDNQLPAAPPTTRAREYNWKLSGTTDCSASCGRGSRFSVFVCVHRGTHALAPSDLCDSSTKPSPQEEPCNVQPCPAFWDIGEWSECSKTCGLGVQHRQVLCRQAYTNHTLNVHSSRCRHLERPETSSSCQMKICSEWQIRSDWSPCSVPCGVGQRSREVHCVSNVGDIVADDECNMKLRPSDVENCDAGVCTKSWFFSDWSAQCSADCGAGVRTRSVQCLTNHISSLPLERCGAQRPPEAQPCNNGPCESRTEWFTGPWSQLLAECGSGGQQRAVVCLMRSDEGFVVMPAYECSSLDKPLSQQSCFIKTCGAKWFHTDWSACSKTCETGYRVREVRCLTDDMMTSERCDETLKPPDKEECHPEPCLPLIDEKCRDKYFNCNVVVQARLCVYDYYQMACCASCTRVAQRSSEHWAQRS